MSVRNLHSVRPSSASPVAPRPVMQGQGGFTLIEALIVISIIAVVTMLAAPSITTALERQRNKELTQSIVSALKEARNEALFRHQDIKVSYNALDGVLVAVNNANQDKIRTYPVGQAGLVEASPLSLVFRPDKKVALNIVTDSLGNVTAAEYISEQKHTFKTYCNADKKEGRTVTVDKIGNIVIDTENSQC